jgi:hypothetical protein
MKLKTQRLMVLTIDLPLLLEDVLVNGGKRPCPPILFIVSSPLAIEEEERSLSQRAMLI